MTDVMKSLPALFALTASILLAGTVPGGPPVPTPVGLGAPLALPSLSDKVMSVGPLLVNTMTGRSRGIREPAPPESSRSGEISNAGVGSGVTMRHGRTHWRLSPVWWAMGALVLVAIVAILVMSARGRSGATVVRG